MQKAYIFPKFEFNLKSTLETKQNKELKQQQDNNQQQEIPISQLILEQKKDVEAFLQKDIKDKSGIHKIIKQIVTLRNKIIVNFASQQNSQEYSALILQTQLYNSFFKLNLSSQQDIEQCKMDILELYKQFEIQKIKLQHKMILNIRIHKIKFRMKVMNRMNIQHLFQKIQTN
ncbi:unnamed protein product [Paramecium pentaurelia]|uniref:Uncharacterized protein n=1 Tax=Paramecium pentaurelia TaxID=43138 RepID=A0A8S1XCB9_9CILI|nr:unnamed protein product [Paramecium pentaurelia]